ncbi:antitoxin VapB family protein [Parapedobacter tibetensis]|uniref:antitoxin VapB family protein n=1 Tax=Parapedobacter tibetensis TaxID=2972951 RepID=UPI00214DB453|nr:antitoxin VapB family protein [Parapedobacter tibetensis]
MKTLNISISDYEYDKLGLKGNMLSFSDFVDLLSRQISRQQLRASVQLAEKYGLSKMTMDDINKEVKTVRKNAKNSH